MSSDIVREFHEGKIQEVRLIHPPCPNLGPCFCTGACRPITVALDDTRTDEQIIADHKPQTFAGVAGALWRILDQPDTTPEPFIPVDATDETDPMWSPLFEEVWHGVTYKPGYRLELKPDREVANGRWYYQVECDRPDAITGEPGVGRGSKAYLSPHATRSELVQTAFGLFKGYEEHECREFFRYDGEQVFGPHIDVLAHHRVARETEVRA